MLVFIDKSGDPGFNLARGSSPLFVAAMAIFANQHDAIATQKAIAESEARKLHKPEFKFSGCQDVVRDCFFAGVTDCPFKVRAIVVQKSIINSPRLIGDKDRFYEYFVNRMISHDGAALKDATVIIDGSGDRNFQRDLKASLRKKGKNGAIKDVRLKDSKKDSLIQLADMCVGAIARSYRNDRNNPDRWRKMLGHKIDDVWDFGI